MSFYGNISNAGRTNLTFDKIYSSRYQMEEALKQGDGVFVGRYVLIEYDDNTFSRREGYINKENNDNIIYADTTYNVPYIKSDSTVDNLYGVVIGDLIYVEDGNKVNYYICDGFNNDNNIAIFSLIQIVKIEDAPNDYILNYTIDKNWANTNDLTKEFENCQGWDSTIWQKTLINGEAKYKMIGSLNSKIPTFYIEAEAPSTEPIAPHFGQNSTNQEYVLHTQPTWGFRVKRAHDENLSDQEINQKYIGYDADDTNKEINNLEKYNGAIYFNNDGFDSLYRSKDTETVTEVTLSNSGYSGKEYIIHDNTPVQKFEQKPDIQELTVHLPAIGNAISDLWDIVYGEFEYDDDGNIIYQTDEEGNIIYEEDAEGNLNPVPKYKDIRNKDIEWGSTEGTRMVNTIASGYSYDKEKTETIAGAINSLHDLMGMIISEGVYEKTEEDKDKADLSEADLDHIYYGDLSGTGKTGYFMKNPITSYIPVNPTKADFDNYINGKNYQDLTAYSANTYYTKTDGNYYFETATLPTENTSYYLINPIGVDLMQWVPVEDPLPEIEEEPETDIIPDDIEIPVDQEINHYYIDNENYIRDLNEEPDLNRQYYTIKVTKVTEPKKKDNEPVIEIFKPTSREVYEENEKTYYRGYLYFKYDANEEKYEDQVFEVKDTDDLNPYPNGELRTYFYVDKYTEVPSTDATDGTLTYVIAAEDGKTPINADYIPNLKDKEVTFISFEDNNYYYVDPRNYNNYLKLKDIANYNKLNTYYTIEHFEETIVHDKNQKIMLLADDELKDVLYYYPGKYFYKYGSNYILGTEDKMRVNAEYFIIPEVDAVDVKFYYPNKYYYTKIINGTNEKVEVLDNETSMKTKDTIWDDAKIESNVDGLVYYLKNDYYVISDNSGILSPGSVWNSGWPIPNTIQLGQLYKDETVVNVFVTDENGNFIIDEETGKYQLVEKTLTEKEKLLRQYEWKELKGFARTLNTINGLILKLNQLFKFDDTLTRDRETIQGCLNTLNDLINDFGELIPGQIAVIDEYGRLKSAELFTNINDQTEVQGWISVSVDDSATDTKITIRHEDAKLGDYIEVKENAEKIEPKFGESFDVITSLNVDAKGHVYTGTKETIQLPKGSLEKEESVDNANVLTDLTFEPETSALKYKYQNVGSLKLTGYEEIADLGLPGGQASISADDTLNQAIKKLDTFTRDEAQRLETKINTVFDDKDTSDLDSVVDLINWTAEHGETVEEILSSINDNKEAINNNKSAIESNDTDILKLQNDLSTTNTNLDNVNTSLTNQINNVNTTLTNNINTVESNLSSSIGDNKDTIDALKLLVGEKSVNTQIGEAIAAENLDQYATDTELNALNERVGNLENNTYQSQIDTLNATIEALQNTIKDLTARIEALENPDTPEVTE